MPTFQECCALSARCFEGGVEGLAVVRNQTPTKKWLGSQLSRRCERISEFTLKDRQIKRTTDFTQLDLGASCRGAVSKTGTKKVNYCFGAV